MRALSDLDKGALACWPQHEDGRHLCRQDRAVRHAHRLVAGRLTKCSIRIRGLSPHPGAWFEIDLNGKRERIRALRSILAEGEGMPGTLLDNQLTIACGKGAVRLTEVQRAGKRPMSVDDFLRGANIGVGEILN